MKLRFPKNIRFECQRCAKCCGDTSDRERNILMLEREVRWILESTKLKPEEFSTLSSNTGPYWYAMRKKDSKCIFLKGTDCQIYPHRPLLCRFYPFWLKKLGAESFEFKVSKECPGVGLGKVIEEKDFRAMLAKALKYMRKQG